MNELLVENKVDNSLITEKVQRNFLQTKIGQAVNTGLNLGIRYVLPDLIEDQVIDIKDSFIKDGFKEGIQTAIDSAINLGKSALGIITGKFENVNQIQTALKTGGIIDSIGKVTNFTINKVVERGILPQSIGNVLKNSKNVILNNITKNIENEFENQINNIEKINKYNENWKNCFNNRDFDGMEREYEKIRVKIKEIVPIESTIKTARTIENLQKLIKNNGKNFDLTQEQLELAKLL
jgi:hypothetical protein